MLTMFQCDSCFLCFLIPNSQRLYRSTPADQTLDCPYCHEEARPVARTRQDSLALAGDLGIGDLRLIPPIDTSPGLPFDRPSTK
jgi:hypothetical protein